MSETTINQYRGVIDDISPRKQISIVDNIPADEISKVTDEKTFVQINRADNQSTTEIKTALSALDLTLAANPYNEYLIEIPAHKGLGKPLKDIRAAVAPAVVRMFDQYIKDGIEERYYY